jgi:hypothetical protein
LLKGLRCDFQAWIVRANRQERIRGKEMMGLSDASQNVLVHEFVVVDELTGVHEKPRNLQRQSGCHDNADCGSASPTAADSKQSHWTEDERDADPKQGRI